MTDVPAPSRLRPPEHVAIGLIQDAEAYRIAAMRVHPSRETFGDREVDLLAPAWHLLCHSSELALKAYLLSTGVDQGSKKDGLMHSSIRHNLNGLYQWAMERGFEPPDEEFGDLIEFLDPYHSAHVFRYRGPGRIPFVPPFVIADILEPVISGVARTVRAKWKAARAAGSDNADLASVGLAQAQPSESSAKPPEM